MLYRLTRALDGFADDVPSTDDHAAARVLLLGSQPVEISRFPSLRGLFRAGAGTDNVPWAEAQARGIAVGLPSAASLDILYEEVAAFACHLVLRLAFADAVAMAGWDRRPRRALRRQTALVVGPGHIGGRVARALAPLLVVETFDARRPRAELRARLAAADVVSLHLPLNDDTRGLVGPEELAALRDGAGIVNVSRAALVDEQALAAEIRGGRLRAAFDVFWEEPYAGPLAAFAPDRFFMTPHVAGSCREFLAAEAEDLRAFVREVTAHP